MNNYFDTVANEGYVDGQYFRDHNKWRDAMRSKGYSTGDGGGGGGGGTFDFDWAAAEKTALEKLTPYYNELLDEADDDVERAKRLINEDYDRGNRYREEDLETQLAGFQRDYEEGERDLRGVLNERGTLLGQIEPGQMTSQAPVSEFAREWHLDPYEEKGQVRKAAIHRAIKRQQDVADVEKTRGVEEIGIEYPRYKRALEEEKKEKAVLQMAPMQRQQEYDKWLATQPVQGY